MLKNLTQRKIQRREKFDFKLYFKTTEGTELLTIFENHRKEKDLSKAEIMIKTLTEFQTRYPENDTVDRMLAEIKK
jgi:hypothetical protein